MDRPLTGILASTWGSSQRSKTFALNSSSFFITKSEARTAPVVFNYYPRTPGDSRPVHDPVSRSLPPTRPRCLCIPHHGYLPRRSTGASLDDPHNNRLLPTDNRAGNRTCPSNRSDTTQHNFFHRPTAKHSPFTGGRPLLTSSPITACSGSGHLVMERPHRQHCTICHSRLHTVKQCEYNMLNRTTAAPICQIESRKSYLRKDERQSYRNRNNEHSQSSDRQRRDNDYRRDDERYRANNRG